MWQCFVDYISTNAGATMVLVGVTVVYVVLVGWSLRHVRRQADAAKEQCGLMREELDRIKGMEGRGLSTTARAIQKELEANKDIALGSLLLDVAFDALVVRLGNLSIGDHSLVAIFKAYGLIKRFNSIYFRSDSRTDEQVWWTHAQTAISKAIDVLVRDEEWQRLVNPAMKDNAK